MSGPDQKPSKPARKRPKPDNDETVGYGHPPRAHQFKPGQSGNPRGRPKGVKSEATILNALLDTKLTVIEKGKSRSITVREGMWRRAIQKAMEGDLKALVLIENRLAMLAQGPQDTSEMNEDDRAVFDAFLQQAILDAKTGGNP